MKRALILGFIVLLAGFVVAMRPAEGQDNLEERVSALETRVAELEIQIATNEPSGKAAVPTHQLQGSVTISGSRAGQSRDINVLPSDTCEGFGGYADIREGADVAIRDQDGSIVGSGRLGVGAFESTSAGTGTCQLPFTIEDVPEAAFYSVEIGNRDPYSISLGDLESEGWTLELSLG